MTVLMIGATSRILEEISRIHAQRGDQVLLVGRDADRLQVMAKDLKIRGADQTDYLSVDLSLPTSHDTLSRWLGTRTIDRAYMGQGVLYPQEQIEKDLTLAQISSLTNYESYVRLGLTIGGLMAAQGRGDFAILGSVAGLRGKQSNLVYASALAGRNTFADGLRHRLFKKGVHVYTLLLGFVDTPMTKDFRKGFLWLSPEAAASKIVSAVDRKKLKAYIPRFWWLIMVIIRSIPEFIFLRTGL